MSPEQLETGEVDARSDVFAVGAKFAPELIAGREAFTGATTTQIERKVIGEQPVPLAAAVPGLDPAIAAIIASALEKDVAPAMPVGGGAGRGVRPRPRRSSPEDSRPPRATPPPPRASGEKKPRRERAADAAYERAVTCYRDGAEESARRFAIEAIAEHPEHAGARHLLLELGRFRDVEPWLPAAASCAGRSAGRRFVGHDDRAAAFAARLGTAATARAGCAAGRAVCRAARFGNDGGTGSHVADSGTMVAPPAVLDSSETLIAQLPAAVRRFRDADCAGHHPAAASGTAAPRTAAVGGAAARAASPAPPPRAAAKSARPPVSAPAGTGRERAPGPRSRACARLPLSDGC